MQYHVNRNELLTALESVQPGLSPKDIIEQSSCFVFDKGRIIAFNDEVFVSCKGPFPVDFKGAVQAAPMLAILNKLSEDEIEVEPGDGELILIGKKRRSGIRMEAEVLLPVDAVETPEDWKPCPADFSDAVTIVQECASRDASEFALSCVHLHPKFIEACDNEQMTRYKVKTGLLEECLIKKNSIKNVPPLGMNEFAETQGWLHFRNAMGLQLSCRRVCETYPPVADVLEVTGENATLPKGLAEACERAEIFSGENSDSSENQVLVELRPGALRIKGTGAHGWYSEVKKMVYDGPPLAFMINPKLLSEITRRHNDCVISNDRLKVDGGKFVFVACLYPMGEDKEK